MFFFRENDLQNAGYYPVKLRIHGAICETLDLPRSNFGIVATKTEVLATKTEILPTKMYDYVGIDDPSGMAARHNLVLQPLVPHARRPAPSLNNQQTWQMCLWRKRTRDSVRGFFRETPKNRILPAMSSRGMDGQDLVQHGTLSCRQPRVTQFQPRRKDTQCRMREKEMRQEWRSKKWKLNLRCHRK